MTNVELRRGMRLNFGGLAVLTSSIFCQAFVAVADQDKAKTVAIFGTWNGSCLSWETPNNGKSWSQTDQKTFSADYKFAHLSTVYEGRGCRGKMYLLHITRGSFSVQMDGKDSALFLIDLKRKERITQSFNNRISEESETLGVVEKDIFSVLPDGKSLRFGHRVLRKPRPGEDLYTQLSTRPSELDLAQVYFRAHE